MFYRMNFYFFKRNFKTLIRNGNLKIRMSYHFYSKEFGGRPQKATITEDLLLVEVTVENK